MRGEDGRIDAGCGAGTKEVEQNSRDKQGERCEAAKNDLEDSKIRIAPTSDAEEGNDGERQEENRDCAIHGAQLTADAAI